MASTQHRPNKHPLKKIIYRALKYIDHYLIVESVSFVLLQDVYPMNPKRTIEIIMYDNEMYTNSGEFIISIVFLGYDGCIQIHPLNL